MVMKEHRQLALITNRTNNKECSMGKHPDFN